MKKYLCCLALSLVLFVIGCTEQVMTKDFGGTTRIEISDTQKFVNITWKTDGNLWVLTRKRLPNDIKETFYFSEKSSFGVMEGTVVIEEK